jgi:hypothetical protein
MYSEVVLKSSGVWHVTPFSLLKVNRCCLTFNGLHSVISQKVELFLAIICVISIPNLVKNILQLLHFWALFIFLFFIQNSVSETGFCLCLQVKTYLVGPNR